jgi:hypothetical protein
MQQALKEGYKVLGSFDFLGNPVGLFQNLGTGFLDFFVEPSKGIIRSPSEFKTGLAKGSMSLLKHTIYGLCDTAQRMTGSAARGLAAFTMDTAYRQERDQLYQQPVDTVTSGLVLGSRSLKAGLVHGVQGIVSVPVRQTKAEGAVGLAKGIPMGLAGIILKPLAGGADMISLTSSSLRNVAAPGIGPKARRRFPRYIPLDRSLVPYDIRMAYGQHLLTMATRTFHSQSYSQSNHTSHDSKDNAVATDENGESNRDKDMDKENYQAHIIWQNSTTVVFTNKRIICFADPHGVRRRWETPLSNVLGARITDDGIKLLLKRPVNKKNPFKKTSTVLIKCTETASQNFVYDLILRMLRIFDNSQASS